MVSPRSRSRSGLSPGARDREDMHHIPDTQVPHQPIAVQDRQPADTVPGELLEGVPQRGLRRRRERIGEREHGVATFVSAHRSRGSCFTRSRPRYAHDSSTVQDRKGRHVVAPELIRPLARAMFPQPTSIPEAGATSTSCLRRSCGTALPRTSPCGARAHRNTGMRLGAAAGPAIRMYNEKLMRGMWSLLAATFRDWYEDRAQRMGAALAYYTIFALTPGWSSSWRWRDSSSAGGGGPDYRADPRADRGARRDGDRGDDPERARPTPPGTRNCAGALHAGLRAVGGLRRAPGWAQHDLGGDAQSPGRACWTS